LLDRKVIITCAVTGGGDPRVNPAIPITPKQIAESSLEAANAGAAVAHIHVRDPESGRQSMEFAHYREVVERIREKNPNLILNLTTGLGGNMVPGHPDPRTFGEGSTLTTTDRRLAHIEALKPELCSLDMGSMNKGAEIFINSERHLREAAKRLRAAGVKPELEVFEPGHLMFTRQLIEEGLIDAPPLIQICLGMIWSAPATPETMLYMRGLLPPGAVWITFGKGLTQFPMMAQGVLLGGHVRIGFEDTPWLAPGELAPSNAALVEHAAKIITLLHQSPASPKEARAIMGLPAG
jgi:uncharacterized protein (DUF849 family)